MSYGVSSVSYGSSSTANVSAASGAKPPKYAGGKINPEWVKWNEAQNKANGSNAPGTTVPSPQKAQPVVCSMAEKGELETDVRKEIPFTPQMEKALVEMQSPEYASSVGLESDDIVDELGTIMAKLEMPIGLTPMLMELKTFHFIEFVIDDSGSMTWASDTTDARGNVRSRKDEAISRILEMVEVLCYLKIPPMRFRFINHNRREVCLELVRRGERPADFFARAKTEIEKMWRQPEWKYGTPMKEALEKSFRDGAGKRVVRYVFGDGVPSNPETSIPAIETMFLTRNGSADNPVAFMSCTNDDNDVEWMKDLEEAADHCSEYDDYNDELREVCKDQGVVFSYTKGLYIGCQLVGAMNPQTLDRIDESVPQTKHVWDLVNGYVSTEEGYRKYWDGFLEAQQLRSREPKQKQVDRVKNSMDWRGLYNEFCRKQYAKEIPAAENYCERLKQAAKAK